MLQSTQHGSVEPNVMEALQLITSKTTCFAPVQNAGEASSRRLRSRVSRFVTVPEHFGASDCHSAYFGRFSKASGNQQYSMAELRHEVGAQTVETILNDAAARIGAAEDASGLVENYVLAPPEHEHMNITFMNRHAEREAHYDAPDKCMAGVTYILKGASLVGFTAHADEPARQGMLGQGEFWLVAGNDRHAKHWVGPVLSDTRLSVTVRYNVLTPP